MRLKLFEGDCLRIKWVDRAKGLAIVLVVLGHVILGLMVDCKFNPNFWTNLSA